MLIIKTCQLTDDMYDGMTDIVLDINEADEAKYAVPDDADYFALMYEDGSEEIEIIDDDSMHDMLDPELLRSFIAMYEMGETKDGREILELSAFTGPLHRKKGYFKTLFKYLSEDLEGLAIRFAVYKNDLNEAALNSIGAVFDHDELLMVLSLSGITEKLKDADSGFIAVDKSKVETEEGTYEEGRAETKYGECFFRIYGENAYVYGILTYDSHRNKGYAKRMLKELFYGFLHDGIREVSLEVSALNVPAVALYESLGFITADRLSYYYMLQ